MDGIKFSDEKAQDIIRGEPELVYQEHLGKLYAWLALSNETRDMYRLQGAIEMLQEVINLNSKARKQIENN